jgi:hypothetical protein
MLLCSGLPTQFLILSLMRAAGWAPLTASAQPLLALLLADTGLVILLMVLLLCAHGE